MEQQLDLIDPLTLARKRGHAGAQRAADKTERVVDPEWTEKAVEAIRKFAAHQGEMLFTMEICRRTIEVQGGLAAPTDLRAWGAVTLLAIRRGLIEPTKTYHPAASSNGAVRRCYRAGAKAA
jgi:hypothetical protein